jgi:hypothetical protein
MGEILQYGFGEGVTTFMSIGSKFSRVSWNIVINYVEICMGMLATLAPSRKLKKY